MKIKENDDTLLNLDFMFDPSVTQRIMAKIDRSEDVYVICDRLNQAIRGVSTCRQALADEAIA